MKALNQIAFDLLNPCAASFSIQSVCFFRGTSRAADKDSLTVTAPRIPAYYAASFEDYPA